MRRLRTEIDANFQRFTPAWRQQLFDVQGRLDTKESQFRESYRRLVSLHAWRSELLERVVPQPALAFFVEAHNDGVLSHVQARLGIWRLALKSLRSLLENVMQCLYYKDHPVELELWSLGKHRMRFGELTGFLEGHPAFRGLPPGVTGLAEAKGEYATLSKAVHGSATSFRMTQDGSTITLCTDAVARLGAWGTRESHVLTAVNLLLMTAFRDHLSGASHINLRKAVSLAVPASRRPAIKSQLGVKLFS